MKGETLKHLSIALRFDDALTGLQPAPYTRVAELNAFVLANGVRLRISCFQNGVRLGVSAYQESRHVADEFHIGTLVVAWNLMDHHVQSRNSNQGGEIKWQHAGSTLESFKMSTCLFRQTPVSQNFLAQYRLLS